MVCAPHPRYNLGDSDHEIDVTDLGGTLDMLDQIYEQNGGSEHVISLPVYMLEHSNIALSTNDFKDPFDSGQAGYIYVPLTRVRELMELGDRDIDEEVRGQVLDILRAEAQTYSSYMSGGAVRYQILDERDEMVDSCGGFYDMESAEKAARECVPQEELSHEE
jgi:hypothetical protein